MSQNNRVFYAVYRAGIAPLGGATYTTIRGLQSVGMTTNFSLEQSFEIGQISIYENIEALPVVEVTMEKVLDGYAPMYTLATQDGTSASLSGRSNARCTLVLSIHQDTVNSASGVGVSAVECSGLYVNNVSYNLPVEGSCTESLTLGGNNKVWKAGSAITFADDPFATNEDVPLTGIQRRENVLFGVGGTILPTGIPGITTQGGTGYNILTNDIYGAHVGSLSVSTDLGRTDMYELGRRGPYHRYANFPVEVTTEITVIASSGDNVSMTEAGLYTDGVGGCARRYNLRNERIYIKLCDGLQIDVGSRNKLSSINLSGGDTGGGNMEITYTYSNFNDLTVYHLEDPNYGNAGFTPVAY